MCIRDSVDIVPSGIIVIGVYKSQTIHNRFQSIYRNIHFFWSSVFIIRQHCVQGRYIIRCAPVQMKAKSLVDPVVEVVFVQFHSQVTYVFDQTICHCIDVILLCVSALQQSRRYKQVHEPDFR